VIVNFSGGKDSTVAALEVIKKYPKEEIELCYQDTGADYLETNAHIDYVASQLSLPVIKIKPLRTFLENAQFRGYFPTPNCRECTSHLKIDPFIKYFNSIKREYDEIIVIYGERADESETRKQKGEWSTNKKLHHPNTKIWRPCFDMTANEVKERVKSEGLKLHPCYDFSERCSCWLCIYQPWQVVRLYAEEHPLLYEQACLVEDEIKHKWKNGFGFNDLMKQLRMF
jgi:3'-phosphoadenosine 5'-phosphosulfate sulfotransferase (PAPS reductase)/FAD synthetase